MNLAPFVATAELGSFTKAAQRLGVSTAAVSKAVARLEADLGVRLLERTSRRVELTPEGSVWLEHAREALDTLERGRARLSASQAPHGPVRLTLSPVLGGVLVRVLDGLSRRYPQVQLSVLPTDQYLSLSAGDADIALRVGPLPDSALIARRLHQARWVTLASPGYLARASRLEHPRDLSQHRCLKYVSPTGRPTEWSFEHEVPVPTTMLIGDGGTLIQAGLEGLGVIQTFDFTASALLESGRLVRVLPAFEVPGPPIHLLSHPQRLDQVRVRAVWDGLIESLRFG